jgi:hypothetical protein
LLLCQSTEGFVRTLQDALRANV